MKTRILVIEDEVKIARFLELELAHEGYEVELAHDGREGYEKAVSGKADLIILDLMLPGLSGIEICRRVRRVSDMPIIMLTAKDDVSDKVMGLDSGADDYMTKSFAIEELLARIRVILKRRGKKEDQNNVITAGPLILFKDEYRVTYQGVDISLSKKEFELLKYLMENKGIVLSREKILDHVWGYDYYGDTNVTDVYIKYLRNKIDQKYNAVLIHTVRGVGYLFKYEDEK
ncbi:Response regulator receiver:Transcriptional regulatory protein-like protein [Dehalobacter sp. UNSWDHB]|jgi:Response regulators consisting of a CheY-like receiver domain and a winged-helix DNA-binding domain|uniref:response regulator transcription factor n=1 Tax=unclassified Dehalobacter TaxID=2635733 RepID=UPI00028BA9B5|nr:MULTISPECIES: response regulator transcription factor [unclassified Dehalobacter]AFV03797.1 Phosphate regulon transcriptional regulatory protein PhoB (SphR) [Dehalobacter sp. DCA]AFV06779.1 Response regulator receiver:Transcriptional regulatory protein-like protein [Dehalobacter sp. CF]EQB21694.1 Response regulator receiver:Transcriptional regulatory protein-like protein [Dehalobacter sp. UNSWDHB]